ncbi:hypothetical protein OSB04_un000708 [Centaurea solstitialis]|uniref:Uncharacterized protein n=1 Tax=Centaurea solstitialis TaxID=347529 RepID=A0AA38S3L6_9ASTR|nr:hypothetical protein OSB04_un000708 [Centaurea solstitialis]
MKSIALLMLLLVPLFSTTIQARPSSRTDTPTRAQHSVGVPHVPARSVNHILIDNDHKKDLTIEKSFRPTTPGHSPGMQETKAALISVG